MTGLKIFWFETTLISSSSLQKLRDCILQDYEIYLAIAVSVNTGAESRNLGCAFLRSTGNKAELCLWKWEDDSVEIKRTQV